MPTFKSGVSGNPAGKPKGALSKRTQLAKLFEPHAEALVNKAVELALSGDTIALRLCIERLIPKVKDESARVIMPDVSSLSHNQVISELLVSLVGQELGVSEVTNMMSALRLQGDDVDAKARLEEVAALVKELNKTHAREY